MNTAASMKRIKTTLLNGAAISLAFVGHAYAQDVEPTESISTETESVQETVIVTARRKAETVFDVPISISVIGGAEVNDKAILDLAEVGRFSPNIFTGESASRPGRSNIAIRGINNRAGIYVDDVFVGDSSAANTLLVDIDRIEVLRGPQGAFFGRNTSAGAVNFYTRSPSLSGYESAVIARAGDFGFSNVSGYVSGPLIEDKLGFKLAAGHRKLDGYDKTESGRSVNGEDQFSLRGELLYDATADFSARLAVSYDKDDALVGYLDAIDDFGFLGNFIGQAAADAEPFDRILPDHTIDSRTEREVFGASLTLDWETPLGSLTSISGYRDTEEDNFRDPDTGPADTIQGNQPVAYESISQEFKLSGDAGRVSWLGGLYYFNDKRDESDIVRLGPDFVIAVDSDLAPWTGGTGVVDLQTLFDNPVVEVAPGVLVPLSAVVGFAAPTPFGDRSTSQTREVESTALYGSVSIDLTDRLELTAGARFTSENLKGSFSQTGVSFSPVDPDIPLQSLSDDDSDFSPSISLLFRPDADSSVYGTISKGFQSGGFNLDPGGANVAERRFDSESVTNFELGFRKSFARNRVQTNVAIFYQDYKDFQRRRSIATNTGQVTQTFNADATVEGVEFELRATPDEHWTLNLAAGYQNAEYGDFPNAPVNSPDGTVLVDLTGSQLPFAPEFTGAFGIEYDRPISDRLDFIAGVDGQYRDSYIRVDGATVADLPFGEVDPTFLLNANLGFRLPGNLKLRARIENILDEEYITALNFVQQSGTITSSLSAPRRFFFEVSKEW